MNRDLVLRLGMCGLALAGGQSAFGQSMTAPEVKGAVLSGQWRHAAGVVTRGADGKVMFLFGQSQPSVVCSPLQVCDIELQKGEVVRDVLVGDTVRWKVEPASSGSAGEQTIHLVVKPAEAGLTTSMIITTSRRTYHIQLKSHPSQYMARVGFDYADDVSQKLGDINARVEYGASEAAPSPDRLVFSYAVSGHARWRPKRVYSDGQKTYIQFPERMSGGEAPVLFVVAGGENRIVNYRLKKNVMVVDYMIDKAILISGVGWRQQKVTISRGGQE